MSHGFEEDENNLHNLLDRAIKFGNDKSDYSDNLKDELDEICKRIWEDINKLREENEQIAPMVENYGKTMACVGQFAEFLDKCKKEYDGA